MAVAVTGDQYGQQCLQIRPQRSVAMKSWFRLKVRGALLFIISCSIREARTEGKKEREGETEGEGEEAEFARISLTVPSGRYPRRGLLADPGPAPSRTVDKLGQYIADWIAAALPSNDVVM